MKKPVNYYCLLSFILLFTKGHQGFFIKHSSGLCLQPSSQYWVKGKQTGPINTQWGPIYNVYFQNTCLHPDAQFRFFEPYPMLYNIGKSGTFLARENKPDYGNQFKIYHSPRAPTAREFVYLPKFFLQQTRTGALKLGNGNCPTPVVPGTNPRSPLIPINGSLVYNTFSCDQEENKFTFGSVTCKGSPTTDVNCHPDQVMVIQNAIYGGRSDMKTCGYTENTNCTVSVTCLIKNLCDGKQKCNITVENDVFKFNPCPGKRKYLYFQYICANTTEPVEQLLVTDVRLSSSLLPNEGFLEIKISDTRRKVCNTSLDAKGKGVVCRQLGYQGVKQHNPTSVTSHDLSSVFSGDISCYGNKRALSECCVDNATIDEDCASLAYVACTICSEPLLEYRANFPDSIFSASGYTNNHSPAKARLSSNSSWCALSNGVNYLDIDLKVIYVINSVTIFGDAVSANWVTNYKLNYTHDKINWMEGQIGNVKLFTGNSDGYNTAATIALGDIKAQVLRIIPITSNGKPCMRIQICGHTQSGTPRDISLIALSSSSLSISWNEPEKGKGHGIITKYTVCISYLKNGECFREYTTRNKNLIIKDLDVSTKYFVRVLANTKAGRGNSSDSKGRFTIGKPSKHPFNVTSNTLSFMLEIPKNNFSYFQVIALKLLDSETPSSSPDIYSENNLLSYAEAKGLSQPQPFIAAVFGLSKMEKNEKFVLGDGSHFYFMTCTTPSTSRKYYNGPLEASSTYSIFQRVFIDLQDDYFSTGWSPATRTNPTKTTAAEMYCNSSEESWKTVVIIILAVIISVLMIAMVAYITLCRPRSLHSPKTNDKVVTNIENKSFSGDTYDEVQLPPSSSMGQNLENVNRASGQYEDLQHSEKEEEHVYQSLHAKT